MSQAGAIKAGMAYVQAYLDDNPVTQGLTKLRAKLISWQSKLGSLASKAYGGQLPEPFAAIARFAASPAGMFTGLLAAAAHTAHAREEMRRLAETAGVSVASFSAAAYAANKYGVSAEALGAALRKMNTRDFAAMLGGGKGGAGMRGFSKGMFAGLGGGDAMERMIALAGQMQGKSAEVQAGMARAAGMTELLPMLQQGADALRADIAHAKELGLVLSEGDAAAAQRFSFSMKDLHAVLENTIAQIGGALVPMITGVTRVVVRVGLAVRDWIQEHKALTVGIFLATAAIVAGGLAVKALAVGMGLLGTVVAVVKGIVAVASAVWSVFNAVMAAGLAIASSWALPVILIGAAIAGLLGYIAYLGGAFDGLGKQWRGFSQDTTSSISAISNALAKNDIEAAWDVVTAYLKTEWQRVKNSLLEIWNGLQHGLVEAIFGVELVWNDLCASMKTAFNNLVGYLQKLWAEWSKSQAVETTASFLHMGDIMGWFYKSAEQKRARDQLQILNNYGITQGLGEKATKEERDRWAAASAESRRRGSGDIINDPAYLAAVAAGHKGNAPTGDQINRTMHEDFSRGRQNLPQNQAAIDRDTAAANAAVEAARKKYEDLIGQSVLGDDQQRKTEMKAAEDDLAAKQKALAAAQAAANAPEDEKKTKPGSRGDFAAGQATVMGTFSGAVAGMLGGGGPQERQAESLENLVKQNDDLIDVNRQQLQQLQRTNDTIRELHLVA